MSPLLTGERLQSRQLSSTPRGRPYCSRSRSAQRETEASMTQENERLPSRAPSNGGCRTDLASRSFADSASARTSMTPTTNSGRQCTLRRTCGWSASGNLSTMSMMYFRHPSSLSSGLPSALPIACGGSRGAHSCHSNARTWRGRRFRGEANGGEIVTSGTSSARTSPRSYSLKHAPLLRITAGSTRTRSANSAWTLAAASHTVPIRFHGWRCC